MTWVENTPYYILQATDDDWEPAMEMAFETFMKFEAKEYGSEGTFNFVRFVTDDMLRKMFQKGEYKLFVAKDGDDVIGMISLRNGNHISLLFVKEEYHRKGVGKHLVKHLHKYMKENTIYDKLTLHAAPYAIPFYYKMGFKDAGMITRNQGIVYTPMEYEL